MYYLVPSCGGRRLWSTRLVGWHYWIATIGIVLYITAMWVGGIMQGLMWRAYDELGFLQYSFVETVAAMKPFYMIRAARRPVLPRRRPDHGLQHVANDQRRRAPSPRCASPARYARRRRRATMFIRHETIEKNVSS